MSSAPSSMSWRGLFESLIANPSVPCFPIRTRRSRMIFELPQRPATRRKETSELGSETGIVNTSEYGCYYAFETSPFSLLSRRFRGRKREAHTDSKARTVQLEVECAEQIFPSYSNRYRKYEAFAI